MYVRSRIRPAIFLTALALVTVFDYHWMFSRNLFSQPLAIVTPENFPVHRAIQRMLEARKAEIAAGENFHFLSLNPRDPGWTERSAYRGAAELSVLERTVLANWESLSGNIPSMYGIADATGYISLLSRAKVEYWQKLQAHGSQLLMNVLGIRYVLKKSAGDGGEVLENPHALPYLFFPSRVEPVAGIDAAVARLAEKDSAYASTAFVEGAAPASASAPPPQIRIIGQDGRGFRVGITGPAAGRFFVWNESFDSKWEASLGGEKLDVKRVNGWSMGATLPSIPAGEPRVLEFAYRDPLIPLGFAIGLVWAFLFLAVLVFCRQCSRGKRIS